MLHNSFKVMKFLKNIQDFIKKIDKKIALSLLKGLFLTKFIYLKNLY